MRNLIPVFNAFFSILIISYSTLRACEIHTTSSNKGFYLSIDKKAVYVSKHMSSYRSNYDNVFDVRNNYIKKTACPPHQVNDFFCEVRPKIENKIVSGYYLYINDLLVAEESNSSNNLELIYSALDIARRKSWCKKRLIPKSSPCLDMNSIYNSLPLGPEALEQIQLKIQITDRINNDKKLKLKPIVKMFSSTAIFKGQLDHFLGYYYEAKEPKA